VHQTESVSAMCHAQSAAVFSTGCTQNASWQSSRLHKN